MTIRDGKERPETLECGSSMLKGAESVTTRNTVEFVTQDRYMARDVSATVVKTVPGYLSGRRHVS